MSMLAEYGVAIAITHLKNLYDNIAPARQKLEFQISNES